MEITVDVYKMEKKTPAFFTYKLKQIISYWEKERVKYKTPHTPDLNGYI